MYKIKSEQGSMTVYVTVVLLTMLIIISTIFMVTVAKNKEQIQVSLKVKEAYEADNAKAADIYASLTGVSEPEYITDGLILHYYAINNTGDGHSNTATTWKDLSGNGNDGIVTGGIWEENYLKFISSNESNGVKTKNNFPIDFNNTFNIVFELSNVSNVEALLGERTTNTNGMMIFNYSNSNKLSLDTIGSGTRINVYDRLLANTRYDISVAFENTTVKTYVNGELGSTMSFKDGNINFPLTIFTAGNRSNSLGNVYSVKVYNRALTQEEIENNYNVDKARFELAG